MFLIEPFFRQELEGTVPIQSYAQQERQQHQLGMMLQFEEIDKAVPGTHTFPGVEIVQFDKLMYEPLWQVVERGELQSNEFKTFLIEWVYNLRKEISKDLDQQHPKVRWVHVPEINELVVSYIGASCKLERSDIGITNNLVPQIIH